MSSESSYANSALGFTITNVMSKLSAKSYYYFYDFYNMLMLSLHYTFALVVALVFIVLFTSLIVIALIITIGIALIITLVISLPD